MGDSVPPGPDHFYEELFQAAYRLARERGLSDREAQQVAKLVQAEGPGRVEFGLHIWDAVERRVAEQARTTLTVEQELFLWNFEDQEARANLGAMQEQGLSREEITVRLYPFRVDLVKRGRPKIEDQVAYAERLAELSRVAALGASPGRTDAERPAPAGASSESATAAPSEKRKGGRPPGRASHLDNPDRDDQARQMRELFDSGVLLKNIARRFGYSEDTVRRRIRMADERQRQGTDSAP